MIIAQLLDHIQQLKQQKLSDKDIKAILVMQGWQPQDLDEAFYLVDNPSSSGKEAEKQE